MTAVFFGIFHKIVHGRECEFKAFLMQYDRVSFGVLPLQEKVLFFFRSHLKTGEAIFNIKKKLGIFCGKNCQSTKNDGL